jgi:hypothetical protein
MKRPKRGISITVSAVTFQVMWYLLVGLAGRWPGWLAFAVVTVAVVLQGCFLTARPVRFFLFILFSVAVGSLMDTALMTVGCYTSAGRTIIPHPWPPFWLLGLWVNLGAFVWIALARMREKRPVQFLAGLFGGPSAYYTGHLLGAVSIVGGLWRGYVLLGLAWGGLCLILFETSRRLDR